ncbi:MAG TPA: exodeoxyribonuclease VII small subunit [Candidatus Saccharimonadales bacterium]|nr:exodeoxyribonuclease VII small subunit [Candidatus Saccharimonadales bacterium]
MARKAINKSYSQLSDELTKIIEWFEGSEVDIDEALAKYEQAMRLIAEIEDYLKNADNKVRKLTEKFDK